MLDTAIAQLRFAASLVFGLPFDLGSLERLIDALRATRREFGTLGPDGAELLGGPALDERDRQAIQLRRFRQQAVRAARETAYYADLFRRTGLDPARLRYEEIAHLPLTPKAALRDGPDAFVRRGATTALRATTSGTTGRPTGVCFSAYELRLATALGAIRQAFDGQIADHDIVQLNASSRATLGNTTFAAACARLGALVCPVGLVDPRATLALLSEARQVPGKRSRVSVLLTYASYLGELVELGPRLGYRAADFGLERIVVGGQIVTAGLKARAGRLFGPLHFDEGYGMTELWPLGGTRCPAGHLHFEPSQGLVEVLDAESGAAARPGEAGTIVATPFPPYRDTTLLLRYDTEDVVRCLADAPSCELRHLPATSNLLGKRRLAVRHEHGWTFPRDILEALEAVDAVPLPARCGFWAVPGGVAVEVVTRTDSPEARRSIERSLEEHEVPLRALHLVPDRRQLQRPLPLRCDLREATFDDAPVATAPGHWATFEPSLALGAPSAARPAEALAAIGGGAWS
jgi:phenylacetate-coenzyme A ligase PaaK-like adenylate-forming protein